MTAKLLSPHRDNYRIGKGKLEIKKEGEAEFKHMGNAPEIEFTPVLEQLDHFSAMEGVRAKDMVVVLEKGGTLRLLLEEFTVDNMATALLGDVDMQAAGGPEIDIFSRNAVNAEVKFTSTNEIGPKWDLHFYNVSFIPSSAISLISDEWGNMEVNGEVLVAPTGHDKAGKFGTAKITNLEGYEALS